MPCATGPPTQGRAPTVVLTCWFSVSARPDRRRNKREAPPARLVTIAGPAPAPHSLRVQPVADRASHHKHRVTQCVTLTRLRDSILCHRSGHIISVALIELYREVTQHLFVGT